MAITQTTPQQEIDNYIAVQIQRRSAVILNTFEYIGMTCANEGSTGGTYKDRTGHLRASVGYLVMKDGVVYSKGGFGAGIGGSTGEAFAQKMAAGFPHGIALIVVAGMNYASAVEARNYNVLTSAELLAEQLVPQLMKTLGFTAT